MVKKCIQHNNINLLMIITKLTHLDVQTWNLHKETRL